MKPEAIGKINLLLIIAMVAAIGVKWQSLPPEIPLFYSRPWGEDQLTERLFIFLLPGLSLVILVFNSLLIKLLLKKNLRFFADIGRLSSLASSILCLISLLKIIFLVA